LKKSSAFSGTPSLAYACWIARKKGEERKMPWATFV